MADIFHRYRLAICVISLCDRSRVRIGGRVAVATLIYSI